MIGLVRGEPNFEDRGVKTGRKTSWGVWECC
jgi:hypothetical protein